MTKGKMKKARKTVTRYVKSARRHAPSIQAKMTAVAKAAPRIILYVVSALGAVMPLAAAIQKHPGNPEAVINELKLAYTGLRADGTFRPQSLVETYVPIAGPLVANKIARMAGVW